MAKNGRPQYFLLYIEKFTIVYINKFGNTKTKQLLQKLAKDVPSVHFLEIDVNHQTFRVNNKIIRRQ